MSKDYSTLPPDLSVPSDDGTCAHLPGRRLLPVALPSTSGGEVVLAEVGCPRAIVYCYPRTGVPGEALPPGWNQIPGARGCTPQSCAFRDHHGELRALGAEVFGLSTQDTAFQREMVERLHLPFPVLSDSEFRLTEALHLPTFQAGGMRLIKRLTLVLNAGLIEHVFYPVFPPDRNAGEVIAWLADHPQ